MTTSIPAPFIDRECRGGPRRRPTVGGRPKETSPSCRIDEGASAKQPPRPFRSGVDRRRCGYRVCCPHFEGGSPVCSSDDLRAGHRLRGCPPASTTDRLSRPACVCRPARRAVSPPRATGWREPGTGLAQLERRRTGGASRSRGSGGPCLSVAISRSADRRRGSRGSGTGRLHKRCASMGARRGSRPARNLAVAPALRSIRARRRTPVQRHVHTDGLLSPAPEGSPLAGVERAERRT